MLPQTYPLTQLDPAAGPDGDSLRSILDAVPYGILIFNGAGQIVLANRVASRYADADIRLRDVATGHDPLAQALRGRPFESLECAIRAGNESVSAQVSAQPVFDGSSAVSRVVLTLHEIAGHAESDQVRDVVFRDNLAGILHCSVDGRIIDCNDAILPMLGYDSKAELLSAGTRQIFYDSADRIRLLRRMSGPGHLGRQDIVLRRRDGSPCRVLANLTLMDPAPGDTVGSLVASVVDVTDSRLQEEVLQQAERRFAAFMHNLPGIAFIKDRKGRYVYHNEAVEAHLDLRPEQIIGRTDADLWPGEEAARWEQSDRSVIETGKTSAFIERRMQPNGQHSWLVHKFPIYEDGEVALLGGIGIDITERTALEEQLSQARKMEALGRLAGGVAHDFNNLLTVISGYCQLTLESMGEPGDRLGGYLQEILNSARRATGLTSQLLAFSRRQEAQTKVFDLAEMLQGMEALLGRVLGEQVELSVGGARVPCPIEADPNQMEQAIMNLAVNARDAMPLGGTLELRCERLDEPVKREDGTPLEIRLEIEDTGIGMDDSVRKQIFDPFFTSKEKGKGTGLGLSTVYGVVSQAGGLIDVSSTPGEGTVFRLYFPVSVTPDSQAVTTEEPLIVKKPKETILLVEDEASVRALTETILRRSGYEVLVADGGPAALQLWEKHSGDIDMVLTDVIMPHMSGGELARHLRAASPRLRILFMTGYADDMIASYGVMAGETQLIQKPFTPDALGRKVRDVLDA